MLNASMIKQKKKQLKGLGLRDLHTCQPHVLVGSEREGVCISLFVFVCSYSHATLLDHGGVLVNHFPVCRPLAGSVAAPSPPKPAAYPPALFPLPPGIEPRV